MTSLIIMVYAYKIALDYICVIIHTLYMMGIMVVHCAYTGIEVHIIFIDGGRWSKGGTAIEASTQTGVKFFYIK
jgi:hypothetical protein